MAEKYQRYFIAFRPDQFDWLQTTSKLSQERIPEIVRLILDEAMTHNPKRFVEVVKKLKARARLREVEKNEQTLKQEKESLLNLINTKRDGKTGRLTADPA